MSLCVSAADFGLAKMYGVPLRPMTPKVVTLWSVHVVDTPSTVLLCWGFVFCPFFSLSVFCGVCLSVKNTTNDVLERDTSVTRKNS